MLSDRTRPIDELMFEIFRVNDSLIAVGDATVKEFGLTSARWLVLGAVALSPMPLSVAQIAFRMGLTRQAVQRLSNEMAGLGLIVFEDNPNDRRARAVVFTPTGRAAYDGALARWREQWTSAMEEILSDDEIEQTVRRLRRLRGLVQSNTASAEHYTPRD